MPIKTLLIDNYDSYTYNIFQLLAEVNGEKPIVAYNDGIDVASIVKLVAEGKVHNIVISPGPGTPTNPGDVGLCLALFQQQIKVPILGICLGFQALALSHGACITRAPEPVHGRLSAVSHADHPLFQGVPSGSDYQVVRYHSLVVMELSLPDCLEPIAWSCGTEHRALAVAGSRAPPGPTTPEVDAEEDLNAKNPSSRKEGLLMGVAHTSLPYYGVQYHPESVGTSYGTQLFINFRDLTADYHGFARNENFTAPVSQLRMSPLQPLLSLLENKQSMGTENSFVHAHAPPPDVTSCLSIHSVNKRRLGVVFTKAALSLHSVPWSSQHIFTELFLGGSLVGNEVLATRDTFWLDSAATDRARFSYMGGKGGPLWKRITYALPSPCPPHSGNGVNEMNATCTKNDVGGKKHGLPSNEAVPGTLRIVDVHGAVQEHRTCFWEWMTREMEEHSFQPSDADAAALPFNFWGGLVGYIGYEMKSECGGTAAHSASTPDASFFLADQFIAVDHTEGSVYAVALYDKNENGKHGEEPRQGSHNPSFQDARQWTQETAAAVEALDSPSFAVPPAVDCSGASLGSHTGIDGTDVAVSKPAAPAIFHMRERRDKYLQNVASCIEALYSGESYELCLTTELHCDASSLEQITPWALYSALRHINPAPYAVWMDFSADAEDDEGASTPSKKTNLVEGPIICCSSPERFLRGERDGWLEAKPIKGTAPRFPENAVDDAAAAATLEASEKDRAENLMIVDLLRNDLGRVCVPGSVHVPSLMQVESFATVHQLVSTVRGQRRAETSIIDAIRAAFPGGSMTGAPKVRSMAILDGLESGPRGVYSGSAGYISFNGTFDLNIIIRTAVLHQGKLSISAGGAIVVQSDPQGEFDEMKLKAAALLRAVTHCTGDLPAVVVEDEEGDETCPPK